MYIVYKMYVHLLNKQQMPLVLAMVLGLICIPRTILKKKKSLKKPVDLSHLERNKSYYTSVYLCNSSAMGGGHWADVTCNRMLLCKKLLNCSDS